MIYFLQDHIITDGPSQDQTYKTLRNLLKAKNLNFMDSNFYNNYLKELKTNL